MAMNNIKPLVNIVNAFFPLKMKIFKIMDANGTGMNGLFVQNAIEKMKYLIVMHLNSTSFRIDFL
jgi:hypothetical protein